MKRTFLLLILTALAGLPASAQKDENKRIENTGKVIVEILNVPEDIPRDLLDKAECVIVLPSVKKFAVGFGGSYGPRSDDLPKRQGVQRTLERAVHDGA